MKINTTDWTCSIRDCEVFKNAGGSLIPLVDIDSISLLALGGYVSDIWVWTSKEFKDRFCDVIKVEGQICKFENPNLIVVSNRWVNCPGCDRNFNEVCEPNKTCYLLAVKRECLCCFSWKNRENGRVYS